MSIETELKTFNGIFERFLKIEEQKTAALSNLANAIISAGKAPQAVQVQAVSEPLLNEAKKPVAASVPAQASTASAPAKKEEAPAQASSPAEKTEEVKTPTEPTKEMMDKASATIKELCNKINKYLGGVPEVKKFIGTFGHGENTKLFSYDLKLQFIEFAKQKLASLEAAHA